VDAHIKHMTQRKSFQFDWLLALELRVGTRAEKFESTFHLIFKIAVFMLDGAISTYGKKTFEASRCA
jgi:hypothetical protein